MEAEVRVWRAPGKWGGREDRDTSEVFKVSQLNLNATEAQFPSPDSPKMQRDKSGNAAGAEK